MQQYGSPIVQRSCTHRICIRPEYRHARMSERYDTGFIDRFVPFYFGYEAVGCCSSGLTIQIQGNFSDGLTVCKCLLS